MIVVVIEDSQIDDDNDNDNEHYFGISKATTVADGEDQGFPT
ncbi:hypothetical protein [Thiobaca trueperi]|uniref:Uncharacterized protein n=1 Tax=Thiobaca trueperi TaxID=127458 RepID=A0A4R3MX03_9GAMM|nr:hypothetical protein [Thiobaca trueperi]TCT20287.1 hypothetical protein EDC35_106215 [Thiobaca trueperi]